MEHKSIDMVSPAKFIAANAGDLNYHTYEERLDEMLYHVMDLCLSEDNAYGISVTKHRLPRSELAKNYDRCNCCYQFSLFNIHNQPNIASSFIDEVLSYKLPSSLTIEENNKIYIFHIAEPQYGFSSGLKCYLTEFEKDIYEEDILKKEDNELAETQETND